MKFWIAPSISVAITTGLLAQPIVSESKFAAVDHIKVHYTNYGKGETAMLFVHGWACDETVWSEQAPALAEKIRVITIDLPGHGQSDKPKEIEYDKNLYARAIDGVMNDAGVKFVILVGHSNGTPFTREFYRKFPAKVKALVVVEGPLHAMFDRDTMEKFVVPLKGDNYPEAAGRIIAGMTRPLKDSALRDKIKALMLKTPQYVAVSEFEATADEDLWKEDKIDVPVLMILAKQPAWSPEYEQFVRRLAPKLDYQIWENVSHFVMMEKPREFNAAVLKFLEENQLLTDHG
ncbi:MAG TPA: alpha/beta hydrolase [Chthoniobacterales bacterium]|nr:alpha/beta hydrolase [Chthoniobacterales bacterium]